MTPQENPHVVTELENLRLQFPDKALLTTSDISTLFEIKRTKVTYFIHNNNIPFITIGRALYIPIQDLALYLARLKTDKGESRAVTPVTKADLKNRRGFRAKAIERQIAGAGK